MKTLKNLQNNQTITLGHQAEWVDENVPMVVESVRRSLSGAAHISIGKKLSGRPITLSSRDNAFWIDRATLEKLRTWSNVLKLKMLYTHDDGRTFTVKFRHRNGSIKASSLWHLVPSSASDEFENVEIYLETV